MKKYSLIALALISCGALAQQSSYYQPRQTINSRQQAQAVVTSVNPLVENVVVGQNCQPTYVQRQAPSSGAGAIIGTVVGGVIGSRFGGGNGRYVATAIGAGTGAMVGHHIESNNNGRYVQQTTQCTPILQQRVTGSQYTANYRGIQFSGTTYRELRVGDTVYVDVNTSLNLGE